MMGGGGPRGRGGVGRGGEDSERAGRGGQREKGARGPREREEGPRGRQRDRGGGGGASFNETISSHRNKNTWGCTRKKIRGSISTIRVVKLDSFDACTRKKSPHI